MGLVSAAEERVSCLHFRVACVFVKDRVIVGQGYNGSPRGFPNCDEAGCAKDTGGRCVGVHAEINAIIFCGASPYEKLAGATAYVSVLPCKDCMLALMQAGIRRIVFGSDYLRREINQDGKFQLQTDTQTVSLRLAKQAGIQVERYIPETGKTEIIVKGRERKEE